MDGEVARFVSCDGVIVVKIDSVVCMTDDPLVVIGVVTVMRLVNGDVGSGWVREVTGTVVVKTKVLVMMVDRLVSKVKTEDPLVFVECMIIMVDIVDVIGEVIV